MTLDHEYHEAVNWERLETDVREFAELFPDTVYASSAAGGCLYEPEGANVLGCIIGAGLSKQGFDIETPELDRDDGFVNGLRIDPPSDFPNARWLQRVQSNQDEGMSWSEAVAQTDRIMTKELHDQLPQT